MDTRAQLGVRREGTRAAAEDPWPRECRVRAAQRRAVSKKSWRWWVGCFPPPAGRTSQVPGTGIEPAPCSSAAARPEAAPRPLLAVAASTRAGSPPLVHVLSRVNLHDVRRSVATSRSHRPTGSLVAGGVSAHASQEAAGRAAAARTDGRPWLARVHARLGAVERTAWPRESAMSPVALAVLAQCPCEEIVAAAGAQSLLACCCQSSPPRAPHAALALPAEMSRP